jgi:hypothetical protein
MNTCEKAIFILQKTRDGEDLAPRDLYLVQEAVNNHLNDLGMQEFEKIHAAVVAGSYKKPWFYGIENLTKDHRGYVYWKGIHVEHYSFQDPVREKEAAEELAAVCRKLEAQGEQVTASKVFDSY